MASQPVEVYHTISYGGTSDGKKVAWSISTSASKSNHFNIIDSYSEVAGRYKGDPIADSVWNGTSDIGDGHSWFVLECQTELPKLAEMGYSNLPKWQVLMQFDKYDFADVSDPTGVKYPKNHLQDYYQYARFAPYGGWDLEDSNPDFNPVSPPASGAVCSQNHRMGFQTGSSYLVVIAADGCLMVIQRPFSTEYNAVNLVAGDVIPVSIAHMPMPRAQYASGSLSDGIIYTGFLAEDGNWTSNGSDYKTNELSDGGFAFWDHNEDVIETAYRTTRHNCLVKRYAPLQSPVTEIDMFPFTVIPLKENQGARFALGHIRKARGKGMVTYNNKTLMTGMDRWTAVFPWDGSSLVRRPLV